MFQQLMKKIDLFICVVGLPVNLKTNIPSKGLGSYTKGNKPNHLYITTSLDQHLSFGGLAEPSAD